MKLAVKINSIADELQEMMEGNQHLESPDLAIELVNKLGVYWAFLDDELKDYVHCSRAAIEDRMEWNV